MTNSNMLVQPYLFFNGRCDEALEFYRSALGAEVEMLSRFKDAPEPGMAQPGLENKVMHASFRIGETTLMASDGRCDGEPRFEGFSLQLSFRTRKKLRASSTRLLTAERLQCLLRRRFGHPNSECLKTGSALAGWCRFSTKRKQL
jgi:PhnB protein